MEGGKENSEKEMEDDVVKKLFWEEALEKDYAFIKQWCEAVKDSPQNEFKQKIGSRIVELIKRDPLSKELTRAIESNLSAFKVITCRLSPESFPPELFDKREITIADSYLATTPDIPDYIKNITRDLESKWYCKIQTTIHKAMDKETSSVYGIFPVDTIWAVRFNILSPVETPIISVNNHWPIDDVSFDRLPIPISVYSPLSKLPIFINLSIIDNNDIKLIKKIVSETVKQRLKEFKTSQHHEKSFSGFLPAFHDKDLMFLYHTKDDIFEQYLKWYDLHMPDKGKRLLFREIAQYCLLETIRRERPDKLKEISQVIKKFKILNKKAQKTIETLIDKKIKIVWEDAIETAVKTIYQAIHRKPYHSKKKARLFDNCPIHGEMSNCPEDCKYLIEEYKKKFNNRMPENLRQLDTIENIESTIEDPKGMKKPAKGKSSKIIGQQKKQEQEGAKYFPKFPL